MEVKAIVWLAKSMGVLLVLVGIYFGISHAIVSYGDRRADEVQKDWDADKIERQRVYAAAMEAERVKRRIHDDEIAAERKEREAHAAVREAAFADLRGQHERLLATKSAVTAGLIRAIKDSGTRSQSDDAAITFGDVFEACSGELEAMGREADTLADRLTGLQSWARSAMKLCGEPEQP